MIAVAARSGRLATVERWPLLPGLVAGAAVLATAIPRLDARPIWLDESYTVGATRDLIGTWRGSGGTQALYYLVMWPVTRLSTDPVWLRLPSALCAAATVVLAHELARRLGGRWTAALTAASLACTYGMARFAIEARSYALSTLLVTLSWLGLVIAAQSPDDDRPTHRRQRVAPGGVLQRPLGWLGLGTPDGGQPGWRRGQGVWAAGMLLAPLAHGIAALQFVGQLLVLAAAPREERRGWVRPVAWVALGLGVEGALLFGLGAGEVADWVKPLNRDQVIGVLHMLLSPGTGVWVVGALVIVGGILAILRARSREPQAWLQLVPLAWLLTAPVLLIALSTVRPYTVPRYVLTSLPATGLLVGSALSRLRPRLLTVGAALVVAVLLVQGQDGVTTADVEDWPALIDHLIARAHDGDRLISMDKYRTPIDYWWDQRHPDVHLVALSPLGRLGNVKRFYDTPRGTLRHQILTAPADHTVWYVDRSSAGLDRSKALAHDPAILHRYHSSGPMRFHGALYLLRLDPRPPL